MQKSWLGYYKERKKKSAGSCYTWVEKTAILTTYERVKVLQVLWHEKISIIYVFVFNHVHGVIIIMIIIW